MRPLFNRSYAVLAFALIAGCASAPPTAEQPSASINGTGKVFVAEKPVAVYRVWDRAKAYTAYGSWRSFSYPEGSKDNYRKEEDTCPEWSSLDRMSTCSIKVGAHVVVGPGQSVDCKNNLSYPQSPVNQVYIPNNSQNNQIYVENCTAGSKCRGASGSG